MTTGSALALAPAKQPQKQAPAASVRTRSSAPQRELCPSARTMAPGSFVGIPAFAPGEKDAALPRANAILLPLQRKLAIGAVNDPLEAQADAMAEQVMRGPASMSIHSGTPALRRKCACEDSGEPCDKCETEKKKKLQRKAASPMASIEAPPIVHEVLHSPGEPLDAATRSFMESRFGRNFSDVRIHTDAQAQESAATVNALAYTTGRHMVFASGKYAPHSDQGRSLLAHELTHVLQQGAADNSARGIPNISASAPKVQRQIQLGVHASPPAGVSFEKYSPDVESMYRRAGLVDAANAVARCRQGDCSKVLTEAEAYAAYRSGRLSAGMGEPPANESKGTSQAGGAPMAAGGAPVAMGGLVATSPAAQTTGTAAKTAVERAAESWGVEAESVVVPEAAAPGAAAAAPGTAAVGTVAVPVALGVYVVVAAGDLIGYASFQADLERQGYVILPHPLGVCIAGCHQPAAPSFEPSDPFRDVEPFHPFQEMDDDAIRKWIDATPTRASRNRPPSPQPVPQSTPQPQPTSPPKSKKCSNEVLDKLHGEMKKLCNQRRSCSMQGDTCASATVKVSAGYACITARENIQKKCFSKGDPGYEDHMKQIAQAYAALRECELVMLAKCGVF